MRPTANRPAAAAMLAAGALLLASCGGAVTTSPDSDIAACATPSGNASKNTPTVAVLTPVGRTTRVLDEARIGVFETVLHGSTQIRARFLLSEITSGTNPRSLVDITLVPEGENDLLREQNIECKEAAIKAAVAKLARGRSAAALDVLSGLRALEGQLKTAQHGEINVLLLGSAVTRTKLADGRTLDLSDASTLADPARAINALARAGLNFRCPGWRIAAVNPSYAADGTPLTPSQDSALRAFWKLYFERCGGSLVAWTTQLLQYPVAGDAVQDADTRTIPIKIERRADTTVATLSSEVLFDLNSAQLRAGAERALRRILPLLENARGSVEVAGHTDNTGTDQINRPLSHARARAVARWIRSHASRRVGRLTIRGVGSQEPVASNRTPLGRARNRRVVITIRTANR
jgi:outer membrane protein OmpA-like peptidoglycan-associated protein